MQPLTPEQDNLLLALFKASKGRAGLFCPAHEDDLPLLESLLYKGLLKLEVEDKEGADYWLAALSTEGVKVAEEILSRPKILGVQIEFDLNNSDQSALVEQLADLDKADVADVLAGLFGLHQSLKRGEIDALLTVYPDAVRTIRRMVQAGVESELMTHEQQRIDQLLDEVTSLKTMLSNQNGIAPTVMPAPDDEDDSAPIPAFKPVTLKPVLPRIPEGQPKQLSVPQFDLPSDGDEESEDLFVVKKDEDAGRRASQNFIESLQKLQK